MWLSLVVGLLSLVLLVVLFNAWGGWLNWHRGLTHQLSDIGRVINAVMEGGLNKSVVRFHDLHSGCWVDFRKSIKKGSPTKFTMVFEPKNCPQPKLVLIESELRRLDIEFTIHNQSSTSKCLTIECGRDLQKAVQACRAVFIGAQKLSLESKVVARMRGGLDVRNQASHGW